MLLHLISWFSQNDCYRIIMEMQEKAFSFTLSFTGHKLITFNTIQYSMSAASLGLKVFILPRAINRTQRIVDNREVN